MKKALLVLAAAAMGYGATAQTIVGTSPANKNVVLEEFTGVNCQYCPDGHRLANLLKANNPGRVQLINVHTGSYANTTPNFQTSFGASIAGQTGLTGYPAGTVNRRAFSGLSQGTAGTTAMSRGSWTNAGNQIMAQASPVNVAAAGTLNLTTRELTLTVEVYYTANGTGTTNKLNVALLQNGITGPQVGMAANPSNILPNGQYEHNHMLRHLLTGQWGEDITALTSGSLTTKNYTYTIPANLGSGNIPVDLSQLEVIVFVAEGQQQILTGAEANITITSNNAIDAFAAGVAVDPYVCTSVSPKVTVTNFGNTPLTSFNINYTLNGTPGTMPWTGSIATGSSEEIELAAISGTLTASNTFSVEITDANNGTDGNLANNTASSTFAYSAPASTADATWNLSITFDQYATETSWFLYDDNGTTVASGGPYAAAQSSTTQTYPISVPNSGCYKFEMKDAYGDGMCCQYGNGSFTLRDASNNTLYSGGTYTASTAKAVERTGTVGTTNTALNANLNVFPNPTNGMVNVEFEVETAGEGFIRVSNALGQVVSATALGTVTGKQISSLDMSNMPKGLYFVNLIVNDKVETVKLTVAE